MLTITHTHEAGTLIDGTARGDGTADVLKAQRWRWSRNLGAWYIPRSRDQHAKTRQIDATAAALRAAGHDVEVTIDNTARPTADVEADKIARQADRAGALAAKAERRREEETAAWARHHSDVERLPPEGEPVKIGHHSEGRHRRDISRAWNSLGRSVEAGRATEEAERRATEAAATTAARYNPVTVANRIDKLEADRRKFERRRDGYTSGHGVYAMTHAPATGAGREQLEELIAETDDALTYWRGVRADQQANGTATNYGPHNVAKGDAVQVRGTWYRVLRANPKSVTVEGYFGPDRTPWQEVADHRPAKAA
ncbi:DUF3560 domain-containing protein [Isoptericola sp. NPDC056134]|uniref:DUF3560 domain-containing protein n=1 Tax=Isoptericola sp. NPDC056134 TaxID=3345723 RepID=UPI0035F0EC79